jgi:hypothetical protein
MDYYEKVEKQLETINEKIDEMAAFMKLKAGLEPEDIFLDNAEFIKLMNISKRTAQHWRDSKMIGYSMIGAKIYYCLEDVLKLLKDNYKHANK